MRTYLINQENEEVVIDYTLTSSDLYNYSFNFKTIKDNIIINESVMHIKKLAESYFSSIDKLTWKKIAKQNIPKKLLDIKNVYDVYYGFKPSGLFDIDSNDLITQMPGKVIDIMVKDGEKIKKGQTLLILEAMKMENEIKANNDGIIKKIHVQIGNTLESGILMIEIV